MDKIKEKILELYLNYGGTIYIVGLALLVLVFLLITQR